jgi:hypothetical protein
MKSLHIAWLKISIGGFPLARVDQWNTFAYNTKIVGTFPQRTYTCRPLCCINTSNVCSSKSKTIRYVNVAYRHLGT